MKRLAAMQDCPLLMTRAFTAVATASSKSALGITMNGSLPHNFFDSLRCPRTNFNARSFTAGEGGGHDARVGKNFVHLLRADQQGLKCALGKTGAPQNIFD